VFDKCVYLILAPVSAILKTKHDRTAVGSAHLCALQNQAWSNFSHWKVLLGVIQRNKSAGWRKKGKLDFSVSVSSCLPWISQKNKHQKVN